MYVNDGHRQGETHPNAAGKDHGVKTLNLRSHRLAKLSWNQFEALRHGE